MNVTHPKKHSDRAIEMANEFGKLTVDEWYETCRASPCHEKHL